MEYQYHCNFIVNKYLSIPISVFKINFVHWTDSTSQFLHQESIFAVDGTRILLFQNWYPVCDSFLVEFKQLTDHNI